MRLIFHNTADAAPVDDSRDAPAEDDDHEGELKSRDEELDELRASLSSVKEDVTAMTARVSGELQDARRTIGSQERQLACAQDLYKFSSEQSKLIADYWQGQAAMKDQNIAFFNQKLADAEPKASAGIPAGVDRFPNPATARDELSCLQDRHDKLLGTCLRLEKELRLLRRQNGQQEKAASSGDGRCETHSDSAPSSSSRGSESLGDLGRRSSDVDKEKPAILTRSSSEPSCTAGSLSAFSPSSRSRRASSLDLHRASSSFSSICSESSDDDNENRDKVETVQNLHHCTWRTQLGVRVQQLERLSRQLDDTYNTSLNLGDQLRQQSEQILNLQQRNDELEVSEKRWRKVAEKAQSKLDACLASLDQQSSELDRIAEKGKDHRVTRSAAAWNTKAAAYKREVESIQLDIQNLRGDLPADSTHAE